MAKKWSEVASSPEFQSLSPSDREAARQQYFAQVIAPQVPAEMRDQVQSQFDAETAQGAFAPGVKSGDEARALAAGNTRASMRPQDIEFAYDTAAGRGDRPESQAMARAYVQRERTDSPVMMGVGDRVRAFARGVPVLGGLADEANAATSALFGGDYQKRLDYERARDATFDEANPGQSTALQVGGGLASGLGIAAHVGPALAAAPRAVALGSGLGGGAALGAADGFTRGEGVDDRAKQAAIGGGIGGLFGLAAPVIGKAIDTGTNAVVNALVKADTLRRMGLSKPAADVLTRTMENDGTLGARGVQNIRSAGPDAMLVDAGPNSAAVLDTAIQRGGPGAVAAREAIEQRAANAGQNVTGALDTALGKPSGVTSAEEALRKGTAAARSSAYDAAYAKPIDYAAPEAREIEGLLGRLPASVIEKANSLMRLEGQKSSQIMARMHQDGSVTYETMPDVRQLDYITRAMRDIARNGDGKGLLGGNTAEGRAYGNLATEIRSRMRTLVPEYGKALDTAAEPIAQREALDLGTRLLSPKMTRDELGHELSGMTSAEIAKVHQGVRAQIDEALANVTRTMADPNTDARQAMKALKDLSSDAAREKIALVIGPKQSAELFQKLDEAGRAFELRSAVAQNSKTFARQATKEAVDQATAPGVIGQAMEGKPVAAARGLVQALLGTGPQAQLGRQDRIYSQVVDALIGPRGAQAEAFARQLQDVARRQGQAGKLGRALGISLGGAAAGGGDSLARRAAEGSDRPRPYKDGILPAY